jgi:TolB-like protein
MRRFTLIVTMLLLAPLAHAADGRISVLVLPFDAATPDKQWIAKAVQQNLVAELSALPAVSAISSSKPATSADDAASAARDANAQYAIFGGVQAIADEVRITGIVVEAPTSQPIGVLRATGAARDLFALQDQIADQAKSTLPGVIAAPPPPSPAAETTRPATTAATAPNAPPAPYATRVDRGIARIEQANDRVAQLEDEIDRLRSRLRELERDQDLSPPPYRPAYYDDYYGGYPWFGGYYYPSFFIANNGLHCRSFAHCPPRHNVGSGLTVRGAFRSGNFAGNFRAGGGAMARHR